ncbi:ion channel TACAN-like [Liolophura sinensis]|uniref:ion channel TACAN-like n=1 Tax=Liolophura sinensis TaxID=3198878 RepID=UPI003158FC20
MEGSVLKTCREEWDELDKEFVQLEEDHRLYQKKLEQMITAQKKCMESIAHHRYRIKKINESLKKESRHQQSAEDKSQIKDLQQKIKERKEAFHEMEEILPHKNGPYLKIILGEVNVSLLNKADKFQYKQEYERFKLVVTYVVMILSLLVLSVSYHRWLDATLHFLLVWYYCTLTIRENILRVNGSRVKGWWVTHHFISTVCAGIILIWPEGYTYQEFRTQLIFFSLYISMVQVMQYYYQSGSLYRLRALGMRHTMDITVEGFMSWMWKGLSFLLPFLFLGYVYQLYNAYTLYHLSQHPGCKEWQVLALAGIFFILGMGNILTVGAVIRQKMKKEGISLQSLYNKYRFLADKNN